MKRKRRLTGIGEAQTKYAGPCTLPALDYGPQHVNVVFGGTKGDGNRSSGCPGQVFQRI